MAENSSLRRSLKRRRLIPRKHFSHTCDLEIAKRAPDRLPEVASRLPKSDNYWDTKVRGHKAFAKPIDLERPADQVLAEAEKIVQEIPALA